jgi:hypothetical protein
MSEYIYSIPFIMLYVYFWPSKGREESYIFQEKLDAFCVAFPDGREDDGDAVLVAGVHVRAFRHLSHYIRLINITASVGSWTSCFLSNVRDIYCNAFVSMTKSTFIFR